MTLRFNPETLQDRARDLASKNLNGFKLVFVSLDMTSTPPSALLDVEFQNNKYFSLLLASPQPGKPHFSIVGGKRIRAGSGAGEVQITQVQNSTLQNTLRLTVVPIGDYSTYTLRLNYEETDLLHYEGPDLKLSFDPLFCELPFKFRPGCFNLNCAPAQSVYQPLPDEPAIDYLARDYDSFRHVLIAAMMRRVPDWQPTSEADLDQVLIDLLAADADELADFQDRVMNEAYFATARKRVSLARYARLMDYHIHEGNQADTWLAVQVSQDTTLPALNDPPFGVWTHDKWNDPGSVIFASETPQSCFKALNDLLVYDWGGTVTALEAGSIEADLAAGSGSNSEAVTLFNALQNQDVNYLVLQQELNPETGTSNGRDPTARQLVRLLSLGNTPPRAEILYDPVANLSLVRVRWVAEDALQRRYCTSTNCPNNSYTTGVSKFYGNLLKVTHGRPHKTTFLAPGAILGSADDTQFIGTDETYYEPLYKQVGTEQVFWGTKLTLPKNPLAFRNTAPGGDTPTRSTLQANVSSFSSPWEEQSDLIESAGDDEHFIVETDELGISSVRFGDGINGAPLPANAAVTCHYRVGQGEAGNVGADTLVNFNGSSVPVTAAWNPFDVADGRSPEPPAEILRRVPEAYRQHQLRAVTLADYTERAEQYPGIANASASYAWTGSWRTVRVTIDPEGTTVLSAALRHGVENYLNAVRLIGEDIEVRPAQYVPLDIKLRLCACSQYWPEDLRVELEAEFSEGYTADGRRAFFHPDLWTFGQPLHASQIIGRVLGVTGVERVLSVSIRRLNSGSGGVVTVNLSPDQVPETVTEQFVVGPFEIIEVANDPSRMESGRMLFEILGGRQ